MKIVTLTLNPAFDIHCTSDDFKPYHECLARITDYEAGGKGVNISRALTKNGVPNTALVVVGEENGDSFLHAIRGDGIHYLAITVPGRIRENITLHTEGKDETRISFHGFTAGKDLLDRVADQLDELLEEGDFLTLTGRNPDGLPMADLKDLLKKYRAEGIHTVIDSRSFTLDDLTEVKPWLIKPNGEEISAYLGRTVETFEEIRDAAAELHRSGIENVMISLGSRGAYLVCGEGTFSVGAPKIKAISTVGAGDSSIGGFLAAALDGENAKGCLCRAVAYGSAACLTSGTRPPEPEDVGRLLSEIKQ